MKTRKKRIGSILLAMVMTFTMVFGTALSADAAAQSQDSQNLIQSHFVDLHKKYEEEQKSFHSGDQVIKIIREEGAGSGENYWTFQTYEPTSDVYPITSVKIQDFYQTDKVTVAVETSEDGIITYTAKAAIDSNDFILGKTKINWKWYDETGKQITRAESFTTTANNTFNKNLSIINNTLKKEFGHSLYYFGFDGFCPGHQYAAKKVLVKASYSAPGKALQICKLCGHDAYVSIPKLVPAATQITKLTKGKKKFTVKWKKKTGINGYQIRYSKNSSMKSAKTVSIYKAATTSKTIKKLKKGKKYYVQVRTFKKDKGKCYYSKWSTKKSVKVK